MSRKAKQRIELLRRKRIRRKEEEEEEEALCIRGTQRPRRSLVEWLSGEYLVDAVHLVIGTYTNIILSFLTFKEE